MQIYVLPGDTLYSIGRTLSLALGSLRLEEPYQKPACPYPEKAVTVRAGDTLSSIAASAGTDVLSLFRMNPNLSGSDRIYPGRSFVTQLEQNRTRSAFVAGYAYPYVTGIRPARNPAVYRCADACLPTASRGRAVSRRWTTSGCGPRDRTTACARSCTCQH